MTEDEQVASTVRVRFSGKKQAPALQIMHQHNIRTGKRRAAACRWRTATWSLSPSQLFVTLGKPMVIRRIRVSGEM